MAIAIPLFYRHCYCCCICRCFCWLPLALLTLASVSRVFRVILLPTYPHAAMFIQIVHGACQFLLRVYSSKVFFPSLRRVLVCLQSRSPTTPPPPCPLRCPPLAPFSSSPSLHHGPVQMQYNRPPAHTTAAAGVPVTPETGLFSALGAPNLFCWCGGTQTRLFPGSAQTILCPGGTQTIFCPAGTQTIFWRDRLPKKFGRFVFSICFCVFFQTPKLFWRGDRPRRELPINSLGVSPPLPLLRCLSSAASPPLPLRRFPLSQCQICIFKIIRPVSFSFW